MFSFVRARAPGRLATLVCVANFAAVPHGDYRLGLPVGRAWTEVLNTDADGYAGSGVGNLGSSTRSRGVARPARVGHPAAAAAGRGVAKVRG